MRARARLADLGIDYKTKQTKATFMIECRPDDLEKLAENELIMNVKKYSPSKTKTQLGYLWTLLQGIADALGDGSTKDEQYRRCLYEYGQFVILPARDHDMSQLEAVFRLIIPRDDTTLITPSGKEVTCHQLQCFRGVSTYTMDEMRVFLDHVVEEAKSLGVDTLTPDEYEHLKGVT